MENTSFLCFFFYLLIIYFTVFFLLFVWSVSRKYPTIYYQQQKKITYLSYLSPLQHTSLMTSQLSQYKFHFSKQSVNYAFGITISYLVIFSLIFSITFQCWLHLGKIQKELRYQIWAVERDNIWVMWYFAKKIIKKQKQIKTA